MSRIQRQTSLVENSSEKNILSSALVTLIFKAFLQEKFWRKCRVDCRCNIACLFTHKVGKKKRVEK